MVRRAAFTLIELIFAIILIALTVLTLPRMMAVISQGIDENIVQEAIFAAAAELNQATTGKWDNATVLPNVNELAKVIDTIQDCENNASLARYRLRPGHILQPLHRKCLDNNNTVAVNANNGLNISLEARVVTGANLFTSVASAKAYKKIYTKDVNVTTIANFNGANNDLKRIVVTIKEDGATITSLYAFSANIGEVDYYKRMY